MVLRNCSFAFGYRPGYTANQHRAKASNSCGDYLVMQGLSAENVIYCLLKHAHEHAWCRADARASIISHQYTLMSRPSVFTSENHGLVTVFSSGPKVFKVLNTLLTDHAHSCMLRLLRFSHVIEVSSIKYNRARVQDCSLRSSSRTAQPRVIRRKGIGASITT